MNSKIDYKKQGKRNRINGAIFERKVRADLEKKGWIVSKWQNNVDLQKTEYKGDKVVYGQGKCVPAKPGRFRMMQTGFPDFIAYGPYEIEKNAYGDKIAGADYGMYALIFVEVKSNGYLKPEEREKAKWYLNNNYCSKFFIAKKGKKRGEIEYNEI